MGLLGVRSFFDNFKPDTQKYQKYLDENYCPACETHGGLISSSNGPVCVNCETLLIGYLIAEKMESLGLKELRRE